MFISCNIPITQRDELYKKICSFLALSIGSSQHPTKCTVFFLSCLYYITIVSVGRVAQSV